MSPKAILRARLLTAAALLFFFVTGLAGQVFVQTGAAGAADGSSWADAYPDLSTALANTSTGEIWVATGTYRPTTCSPCDDTDRQIAFLLPPGVQLYGGFNGTETALDQRDWAAFPTRLSGDIGTPVDSTDNSYRVLIAENSTTTTVLDGFIVEEGNADGSFGLSAGGGLLIDANPGGTGDLQVRNCTFRNNYAGGGGAIAIDCVLGGSSQARIENCHFEGNTASLGVVSTGAAIFMQGNSGAQLRPRITDCTFVGNFVGNDGGAISATPTGAGSVLAMQIDRCRFENNRATDRGGAIWYRMSSSGTTAVMIRDCSFTGNVAGGQGGAVFARSSFDNIGNDTLLNCVFSRNRAEGTSTINDGEGGAVFLRGSQNGTRNHWLLNCVFDRNFASERGGGLGTTADVSGAGTSTTRLVNCTFFGNTTAGSGGAIHTAGGMGVNSLELTNSILWRDSTATAENEIANAGASVSLTFSNIAGGVPAGVTDGGNNTQLDPVFAAATSGDLRLLACSPLIDAGNTTAVPAAADPDPDGDARVSGAAVDLGAYERGIRYVDRDATGANTGRSWTDAFTDLQDALNAVSAGDQIWVAEGTYLPTSCAPCDDSDRQIAFRLIPGTELYGGFNGTEISLDQRDWVAFPTLLSGDIGTPADSTDNSYRVLIAENASDKTVLDGFTVEEGNADGSFGFSAGGGLLIDANPGGTGDLQVHHCTFRRNYAGGGGGVAIDCVLGGSSAALFRDCRFEENTASLAVVSTGAAVFMQGNSGAQLRPRFVNCTFQDNYCGNDGGAFSATPTGAGSVLAFEIDSCRFTGNRADDRGGAIWYRMSSDGTSAVVIRNSTFENNSAGGQGGALFARSSFDNMANDTLINCRFVGNRADGSSSINDGEGGAIFLRGSQSGIRNHQVINCLFVDNFAALRGGAVGTTAEFSAPGTLRADIVQCTFSGNATDGDGGAVHSFTGAGDNTVRVRNSILWNDSAAGSGSELAAEGAGLSVSFSDVQDGIPAPVTDAGQNLDTDPLFVAPAAMDFHLSGCSPLIDTADPTALPPDRIDLDNDTDTAEAIPLDLAGGPRQFGPAVDPGAYEWAGDPPALGVAIAADGDTVLCAETSVSLAATTEGGTGNLAFDWDNGLPPVAEQTLSPDTTTTYVVTASDEKGCVATDTITLVVRPAPDFSITGSATICPGSSTTLATDADFAGYQWSDASTEPTLLVDAPGTYAVTVTDTDGCTAADSLTVTESAELQPSIAGEPAFCAGDSTSLDAGAFAQYLWSTGDTTQTIVVAAAGAYTVTVTDAGGCTGVALAEVSERPTPEFTITGSATICPGSATTLATDGDFASYLWSDASTEATLLVEAPGTYAVTVTDTDGCTAADSLTVTENEELQPSIAGEPAFCAGDSTTLDAGAFAQYLWSTGDTTQTIVVVAAGAYAVTVTDAGGCTGVALAEVSERPEPEFTITGSATICPGSSTTLATDADFAGYLWSDASTEATLLVEVPGTYAVTVTDTDGCTAADSLTITESEELQPAIAGETAICAGDSTTLDAGAFAQYLWSTGDTTQTIVVAAAGAYTVTVTDAGGCTGVALAEVSERPTPEFTITGSATICPGSATTLATDADFAGYLWSDASTEATLLVEVPGTYAVTVTDTDGCTATDSLTVTESAELQPNIAGEPTFCAGDSTSLDAGAFAQYLWSTGDTTQTIVVAAAGAYAVTVTDAGGCTGVALAEVSERPTPEFTITGSATICPGSATTLATGGDFAGYLWSDASTEATLLVEAPGTYAVTVTDTDGCTATNSLTVTESAELQPNIAGEPTFCAGDSTSLDAGAFAQYLWSTGDTTQTIVVAAAGDYAVTVTNAGGCTGVALAEVSERPEPEFSITGSATICLGSATTLATDGDFAGYLWSDASTEATLLVEAPGTYAVTVTDTDGCTAADSLTVTESEELQPNIAGEPTFCAGDSTSLDAGAFAQYLWSTGDTTQTIVVAAAGDYAVTVTDAGGCTGVALAEVSERPTPEFSITGSATICPGSATTLATDGDFAGYLWSDASTEATLLVEAPGTYAVTVTDTDGCTAADSLTVTESEELQPNIAGEPTFCAGDSTSLDAGAFAQYLWSTGDTTQTIVVAAAGAYAVTVTDAECTGIAVAQISERPAPEVSIAGSTTICPEDSTMLAAGNFVTYAWSTGAQSPTITVATPGEYAVTVTDSVGCTGIALADILLSPAPLANADRFTLRVQDGLSELFSPVANDQLPADGDWEAFLIGSPSFGTATLSTDGRLTFTVSTADRGEAVLRYALCHRLCPDLCSEAEMRIEVVPLEAATDLPNAITPNGDGINDTFVFDIILNSPPDRLPDNRLLVFNRWGDVVFEQREYDNTWGGTNQEGERLPHGTYYYILYLDIGEGLIVRGDVTILD